MPAVSLGSQTTRVLACWDWSKKDPANERRSWHEIARPQIHGHDISCLAVVGGRQQQYVSGAEEKVGRVYQAPGLFLDTLAFAGGGGEGAGGEEEEEEEGRLLGANMSALGLSQKPIYANGRVGCLGVKILYVGQSLYVGVCHSGFTSDLTAGQRQVTCSSTQEVGWRDGGGGPLVCRGERCGKRDRWRESGDHGSHGGRA